SLLINLNHALLVKYFARIIVPGAFCSIHTPGFTSPAIILLAALLAFLAANFVVYLEGSKSQS
ncbi:MAG: hypothetical protein ACI9R7_002254, partial [Lysobacterales bacterium]